MKRALVTVHRVKCPNGFFTKNRGCDSGLGREGTGNGINGKMEANCSPQKHVLRQKNRQHGGEKQNWSSIAVGSLPHRRLGERRQKNKKETKGAKAR